MYLRITYRAKKSELPCLEKMGHFGVMRPWRASYHAWRQRIARLGVGASLVTLLALALASSFEGTGWLNLTPDDEHTGRRPAIRKAR